MLYTTPGTLAHYQASPFGRLISSAHLNTATVAINCKTYYKAQGGNMHCPEGSALEFYVLNHLAAIVRKRFTPFEKLPEWAVSVMDDYENCLRRQAINMVYYVLLITTRESRHLHPQTNAWWDNVATVTGCGNKMKTWYGKIKGNNSMAVAEMFMSGAPHMPLGKYMWAGSHMFHKGKFSGGFGGKPWGIVADTLHSMVEGKTSAEMLLDTAYTLAHNNGPIFNKGMLYSHYKLGQLKKILDVQHSGQTPELVLEGGGPSDETEKLLPLVKKVAMECPNEFGSYVDWFKVESMGSKEKYPSEKKAQTTKYGTVLPSTGGPQKIVTGSFMVMPGQSVTTYKRKKAA